jgi:hypothetical protein
MQNNITILILEPLMDIIKIIRIKFSSFKKINISEIQIFHPQPIFFDFTKKEPCTIS